MADSIDIVRTSYGSRANEYVAALGTIDHVAAPDLALVGQWATGLNGPVLDVGCGPGQWTRYIASLGIKVAGVDPVPHFIESAQANYPGLRYRTGRADSLGCVDGELGGVLAWYSLIHMPAEQVRQALTEFARCVQAGGGLALGFFTGPKLETFEHAITTAYYWPMDLLTSEVENAGFTVTHTETRTDPGSRPHGAILATRSRNVRNQTP